MLRTPFNFYKTLTGHIATINLKHSNEICLTKFASFSYSSNILADKKILFDFLFHNNTSSGLSLVHLGLFYLLVMIQWDWFWSTSKKNTI